VSASRVQRIRASVSHSIAPAWSASASQHSRIARATTRIVELDLVHHPRLSRPEIIRMDYGMTDGSIRTRVRAAVAGYVLLRWSVDASPDHSLKEEQ